MERSVKHEPQEIRCIDDDEEETKASRDLRTDISIVEKQPQSLILRESPLISDHDESSEQSLILRRNPQFRALQTQLKHLRIENEGLRRQIERERREGQRVPAELKWLIYFRAPTSKAQVLIVVREGLKALLAKDPTFRRHECATSWVAQEHPDWQAFRIDYLGFKIAAFRSAMKAAHADSQLPANSARTTQPPQVTLYRQQPDVPCFSGKLEELATALRDSMDQVLNV